MSARDVLAMALHDKTCPDRTCEPTAMGAHYAQADELLDILKRSGFSLWRQISPEGRSGRPMVTEPATKGYEITRHEVRQFMRSLGLDPAEVESVRIVQARAVATLTGGSTIHIRIVETRKS